MVWRAVSGSAAPRGAATLAIIEDIPAVAVEFADGGQRNQDHLDAFQMSTWKIPRYIHSGALRYGGNFVELVPGLSAGGGACTWEFPRYIHSRFPR